MAAMAMLAKSYFSPKFSPNFLNFDRFSQKLVPQSIIFHGRSRCDLSLGLGAKNFGVLRLRAASDGGSGSTGDGGDGDDDDDVGEKNEKSLLSWYMMALNQHPVITKAITSALLNLLGDVICQLLIDQVPKFDWKRASVFTFLGLVLVGPTLHFWYLYLSKLVTTPGVSGAFLRLLLDQLVFSPIFIGVFLSTVTILEGKPSQIRQKLQQVLAANVVALAWNVILSFKAHKEVALK